MFTNIYSFEYYRAFKSGLLLDFFVKKLFLQLAYCSFFVFNIIFSEKYFIEFLFLRLKNFIKVVQKYLDNFSNEFTYSVLSLFILTVIYSFVLLYLIIDAFTHDAWYTSLLLL